MHLLDVRDSKVDLALGLADQSRHLVLPRRSHRAQRPLQRLPASLHTSKGIVDLIEKVLASAEGAL